MPTPTYTPLATVTLGSSASSVTFSSIPATYRDLIIVLSVKSTSAADQDGLFIRLNNDSSNGSRVTMLGRASNERLSDTGTAIGTPLAGNPANLSPIIIQVMDYSATDKHKSVLVRANSDAPSQNGVVAAVAGRWASTSAVTSVVLLPEVGPNFASGSTFNLFGVIA